MPYPASYIEDVWAAKVADGQLGKVDGCPEQRRW
jgi:hypothetical protein